MSYLPTLRHEQKGAIVLDGGDAAHELIRTLADLYREDPEGVGDMLIQVASLKDQAERERDLDGLGRAEHLRDEIVAELLNEIGGAEIHLDPRDNHYALMQARSLAYQARRIAEAAQQRADELAVLTAVARGAREERRKPPVY
ncbi:hypothetical protein FBY35_5893 [Streptomyces sp. SLBN-118]|uniref:hypothetical protein n=1 Tax=Streptomyces sp. SLBN-118 TaxID=2768454 RepID=UPI0011516DE6|nr:hypothetical protein [Streptomyces sp. SLBN-118]TQK44389.1 hypothetical protein FBY35_5893 [Streptomyces sp. SLBN-118]